MYVQGRSIPFLKIAVPCWISFVLAMGFIGHTVWLMGNRPARPDVSLGYVIELKSHMETYYISATDQLIRNGFVVVFVVYMLWLIVYFWRLLHHNRSA